MFFKNSRSFSNLLLGLILWVVLIIPFVLPIIIPFFILRKIVHFLAKLCKNDLICIENVADSLMIFSSTEDKPSMNATQVWRVRGKLDISDFRQHFYNCFLATEDLREKYRNFYCYFVQWMGYCFKKPVETLILEDRIRELKLEDGASVEGFVGQWMARGTYGPDYNSDNWKQPSWEILILCNQKADAEPESYLLFKIHHGLCDGYTMVHLVEKLSGIKSPYNFKEEEMSYLTKVRILISAPKLILEYHLKNLLIKDLLYRTRQTDPKWFISFGSLSLEAVKKIRLNSGTHFNSVLISIFVGALRRHFLETAKISEISQLPQVTWVGSALGWPNHPSMTQGGMTNHLTLGGYRVPLKNDDPRSRLTLLEQDYNRYEEVGMNKLVHWAQFRIIWVFPAFLVRFAGKFDNFGILRFTTYVSPLICSTRSVPYTLMGLPVQDLYLPVLTPSLAGCTSLYVVPVTHSGKIDFTINASSEVVKDQAALDRLVQHYFKDELERLGRAF